MAPFGVRAKRETSVPRNLHVEGLACSGKLLSSRSVNVLREMMNTKIKAVGSVHEKE